MQVLPLTLALLAIINYTVYIMKAETKHIVDEINSSIGIFRRSL
jgi:hypothetical protein